jgi:hypothetical protein
MITIGGVWHRRDRIQDLSTLAVQSSFRLWDTRTAMVPLADLANHQVDGIEEKAAILSKSRPAPATRLDYGFDIPQNFLLTATGRSDAAGQHTRKEER